MSSQIAESQIAREQEHSGAARSSSPGEWLCRVLERFEIPVLLIVLAGIFAMSYWAARTRPLWFDELLTMLVARQPTLHEFALAMPSDAQPPLLAFLVRHLVHVFGPTSFAARLPSMLAFVAACAGVYVFVRRRYEPVFAFAATAVMVSQPAWTYSFEARPYALVMGIMAWSLVCWQSAVMGRKRTWWLVGLTIGIAFSTLAHHLAIFAIAVPIFFAEIVRWKQRRRFDWLILSPFLIAPLMWVFTVPMMRRTRDQTFFLSIGRKPPISIHTVLDWMRSVKFYLPMLFDEKAMLFAVLVLAFCAGRRSRAFVNPPWKNAASLPEVAAMLGSLLLIPLTMILMGPSNNYYHPRYGIGCLLGFAILGAFAAAWALGDRRDLVAAFVVLIGINFIFDAQYRATHNFKINMPDVPAEYANEPLAMTNCFQFFPVWWYGSPQLQRQLYFLLDMKEAINDNNAIPEVSFMLERDRLPAHIEKYPDFVAAHDRFVAWIPAEGTGSQLSARLAESGFQIRPIGAPGSMLYEAERSR